MAITTSVVTVGTAETTIALPIEGITGVALREGVRVAVMRQD